jgi:hypothetical protein
MAPMSADPIPPDRADAFNKAIAAFHNWTIEENWNSLMEPEIVQRHSISAVCNFVEAFNDPQPVGHGRSPSLCCEHMNR